MDNLKDQIRKNLEALSFFQVAHHFKIKIDGVTKRVFGRNNDSIITPQNWEQKKDAFFKQRLENYSSHYVEKEKIKLEQEIIEKLHITSIDQKIIRDRYSQYLKSIATHQAKNYPAKFYALYHWLKIEMGIENQFPKNLNDQFIKKDIEAYAKEKYPDCGAQGFYRSFKDLDIKNRNAIAKSFGNGYKEKLIIISNDDNKLRTHLKNYPN